MPKFEDLSRRKPKQIGIVFRCDACAEPVFLKFPVKGYTALRVELAPNYVEVERARENFPLTYLPEEAEGLFKEALGATPRAASMPSARCAGAPRNPCSASSASAASSSCSTRCRKFARLAELDDDIFVGAARACCSAATAIPGRISPLDAEHAGMLLEVMRDLVVPDLCAQGAAHAGDELPQVRARPTQVEAGY